MDIKRWWRKEKYVVIHGQSVRFRIVKYLILLAIAVALFQWGGWRTLLNVFGVLLVLSLMIHFYFRYKTKGWRESWGPYKKMHIPE